MAFDPVARSALGGAANDAVARAGLAINALLGSGFAAGSTTDWLPAYPYAERFMAMLESVGTASGSIDYSNDGVNSAGQLATWALDTAGVQVISPPIKSPYPYLRITVLAATAPVTLGRGA